MKCASKGLQHHLLLPRRHVVIHAPIYHPCDALRMILLLCNLMMSLLGCKFANLVRMASIYLSLSSPKVLWIQGAFPFIRGYSDVSCCPSPVILVHSFHG